MNKSWTYFEDLVLVTIIKLHCCLGSSTVHVRTIPAKNLGILLKRTPASVLGRIARIKKKNINYDMGCFNMKAVIEKFCKLQYKE